MIGTIFLSIVGYGIAIALLCAVWKANARRWSRLAQAYRANNDLQHDVIECHATQSLQTVILAGGNVGWNAYKGIVTVGVTSQGILLRVMTLFSAFHPPLLIPFRDIHIEPRQWYLIGRTSQLTLAQVSDVQIILHDETLHWIASQTAQLAAAAN